MTWPVRVGSLLIGSDYPIRLQSMTNTSTLDTDASVAQVSQLHDAGADIVRLTAQGVAHARNLGVIRRELRRRGIDTPLVNTPTTSMPPSCSASATSLPIFSQSAAARPWLSASV